MQIPTSIGRKRDILRSGHFRGGGYTSSRVLLRCAQKDTAEVGGAINKNVQRMNKLEFAEEVNISKKVLILYFSGVGVTKSVAERMFTRLSLDCEIDMFSIENEASPSMNEYDALIIGTPVYHGAPPKIVMRYFEMIPRLTKETPAFIYNTRGLASFNTNRLLSRKLYQKNIMTVIDREYRGPASDGTITAPFIKQFFKFEKDIEKKINSDCANFLKLLENVELQIGRAHV